MAGVEETHVFQIGEESCALIDKSLMAIIMSENCMILFFPELYLSSVIILLNLYIWMPISYVLLFVFHTEPLVL